MELKISKVPTTSRVSLIKGDGRREITTKSLESIRADIERDLAFRQPVIKPNFVSSTIQLASSHVDQIRGILDFISGFYKGKIIIAEASAHDTREAYRNFGYERLPDEYNVELLDLNEEACRVYPILARLNRTIPLRLSCLLLNKAYYIISAAKLKTHDRVVVTLSLKNMAMGCIRKDDKALIHQGVKRLNLLIAELAGLAWPDLSVIDGFEGMEGDGPTHGDAVHLGLSIASTDPLAADRVACEIMGVHFDDVGYLHYCAEQGRGESNLDRIEVVGERLADCIRPFRLHRTVEEQYGWK